MRLTIDHPDTYYLSDTEVENIFIAEYMPDAPGDYVKVYLLALMYAKTFGRADPQTLARDLRMSGDDVRRAFSYWKRAGLIKTDSGGITFLSLKEDIYGVKPDKDPEPERTQAPSDPADREDGAAAGAGLAGQRGARTGPADTRRQQRIYAMFDEIERITRSLLGGSQMETILGWIEDLEAEPEVITAAFDYCVERGKNNISYVEAVVKNWTLAGMRTREDVERYLQQMDERHYTYRRVMKALGFNRNPSESEQKIISSWTDELGCTMDEILDACARTSGISNPNINYVNSVIRNRRAGKNTDSAVPRSSVTAYYERLRKKAEDAAAEKRGEIYDRLPRIREIDEEAVECNLEMTRVLMSGDRGAVDRLREKLADLEKEKTRLLTENGIPADIMDPKYRCAICGDTGITRNGEVCSCYEEVSRLAAGTVPETV